MNQSKSVLSMAAKSTEEDDPYGYGRSQEFNTAKKREKSKDELKSLLEEKLKSKKKEYEEMSSMVSNYKKKTEIAQRDINDTHHPSRAGSVTNLSQNTTPTMKKSLPGGFFPRDSALSVDKRGSVEAGEEEDFYRYISMVIGGKGGLSNWLLMRVIFSKLSNFKICI